MLIPIPQRPLLDISVWDVCDSDGRVLVLGSLMRRVQLREMHDWIDMDSIQVPETTLVLASV